MWPGVARAQQPERVRRIGVLSPLPADHPDDQVRHAAFLEALRQLGWTDGRNVRIEPAGPLGMPPSPANTRRNWSRSRLTSSWQLAPRGSRNAAGNPLRANRVRGRP